MVDILTLIEQCGAHVNIAPGAVDGQALANHLLAMRVAGHAVVADEVFTSANVSLGVRVTHYLSCRKCKGDN